MPVGLDDFTSASLRGQGLIPLCAGAVDSWAIWNLIGLYPVVTQPIYLLGGPHFEYVRLDLGRGKTLTITATNLNPSNGSYFVQSERVNGAPWNQSRVIHDDITVGNATIDFELGTEPIHWDIGSLPPSSGHHTLDL